MRMTCDRCEGEQEFDLEPPDYDVGLMGFAAALCSPDDPPQSGQCQCTFTPIEIEALELRAAMEAPEYLCGEP